MLDSKCEIAITYVKILLLGLNVYVLRKIEITDYI